jgi:hypothetical protein
VDCRWLGGVLYIFVCRILQFQRRYEDDQRDLADRGKQSYLRDAYSFTHVSRDWRLSPAWFGQFDAFENVLPDSPKSSFRIVHAGLRQNFY